MQTSMSKTMEQRSPVPFRPSNEGHLVTPVRRSQRWFFALLAGVVVGTGLGVWGNWPWLVAEHQRLEPWKIPVIWLTELIALFWFVRWGWRYCTSGQRGEVGTGRVGGWVVLSLLAGLGGDLAITLITLREEAAAYASAVPADAQVVAADLKQLRGQGGKVLCALTCAFRDGQGDAHEVLLFAGLSALPAPVEQALRAGQLPVAVPVVYDPAWPGRCWLAGSTAPHHNRLYFMSFSVILFHGLLALALLALRRLPPGPVLPPEQIGPFLAVALVLFLSGVAKLLSGEAF